MRASFIWALALFLAVFAPVSASAETVASASAYRLGTGDKLRITVYGEEQLTGEYEVDGNGIISMPLVNEIQAGGLTVRQFADNLTKVLSSYLKGPRVSAEVINYRPFYILGEVKTPGQYPYVNGLTVLGAVALAGGYTYRANEDNVVIKRNKVEQRYPADETTPVFPGDAIIVKERFF